MQFLESFNFKATESDKCVFVSVVNNHTVFLALYVDDGLSICESLDAINKVLNYLKSNFQITVGSASDFVGMEIKRDNVKGTIKICQTAYVDKVLNNFGMLNAKASSVPAESGLYLCKSEKNDKNVSFP